MYEIRKKNEIYFKNIEGESKSSDSFTQYKIDIDNEDDDNRIIRRALKTGTLKFGDQFYTLEMIEIMVLLAQEKGYIEQIPKIARSLYQEIIKSKNQKK